MHGQFSVKSDVFSFGVLVLEIVSGHKTSGIHHGERMEDLLSFVSLLFCHLKVWIRRLRASNECRIENHNLITKFSRHGETGRKGQL